jgi:hypothetical protein
MGLKTDKIVLENTKAIEPINNGEITYNFTLSKFRKKENGVVSDLNTTGGGGGTPAGNAKEIQYNNAGVFGGATNVKIESGNLSLIETTDPTPVAGTAIIYSKNIAGKTIPKWQPPSGVDTPFQSGIFFNQVSLISAGGGTTITTLGCTLTNVGTISNPTIASTNIKSQTRRFTNTSLTTVGSLASTRIANLECWRGNVAGLGGFFVVCRFGLTTLQAGMRAFFGLSSTATTAPTNVDPITTVTDAKIGMAINANTGNWRLIQNAAGIAPTVLDLGANFPVNNTDLLELILFAKPNDTVVTYRIKNLQSNIETSGTLSTNLPANTAFLGRLMWATNNATAAAVTWDCSRFGLETDF